jgi:hypothetical protein
MTEKERLKMDGNTTKVGSGLWALGSGVGPKAKSLKPKAHPGLKPKAHRGTVLILVVVLMAILAIMGTTFVITSRIERVAAENQVTQTNLNQAFESTLAIIKSTLAEDLWGRQEDAGNQINPAMMNGLQLLGLPHDNTGLTVDPTVPANAARYVNVTVDDGTGTGRLFLNEPWDAPTGATTGGTYYYFDATGLHSVSLPVDGDPWLASFEKTGVFWPRLSELTQLSDYTSPAPSYANATGEADADADGDGQPDSNWKVVPVGGDGVTYRVAVRIVDTCGTVNVNTAWRWPRDMAAPTDFLGNTLAGVNLYNPAFGYTEAVTSPLPGRPDNTITTPPGPHSTLQELLDYQANYILQIESPNWTALLGNPVFSTFVPLDLSDELELRYHWAWPGLGYNATTLDRGSRSALEMYWALDGDTNLDALVDDTNLNGVIDAGDIPAYGLLEARRFLTAYSFSRHIRRIPLINEPAADFAKVTAVRPKDLRRVIALLSRRCKGGTLSAQELIDVTSFVRILFGAFLNDPNGAGYADGLGPSIQAVNYHTWQYIANLVDYLDSDDEPTVLDTTNTGSPNLANDLGGLLPVAISFDGSTRVYGLERHAAITEVGFVCEGYALGPPETGTYSVRVELHNPWGTNIHVPDKVHVKVTGTGFSPLEFDPSITGDFTSGPYLTSLRDPTNTTTSNDFSTAGPLDVTVISYKTVNGINVPEDVFYDTIILTNLPTTPGVVHSLQRDTTSTYNALTNAAAYDGDPAADTDVVLPDNTDTLAAPNVNSWKSGQSRSGYATSTTALAEADTYRDSSASKLTDTTLWDSFTVGANTYYVAKIHNLSDLAAVPYVGYVRDPATSQEKGIGDWLKENDNLIHFDFTENTSQKGGIFRDALVDGFELIGRADDAADNNGNGVNDDLDEMRLPGLINVNTAPTTVLQALHAYLAAGTPTVASTLTSIPFKSVGDVLEKHAGNLAPGAGDNFFVTGVTGNNDVVEKATKWTRFASLTANRSDTFVAYILIEARKDNTTVQSQRAVVLFDRSLCNQPPMKWDGTNNIWIENPAYRLPRVVARQMGE